MKVSKNFIIVAAIVVAVLSALCVNGCGNSGGKGQGGCSRDTVVPPPPVVKPLNISVFLDLSDRIQIKNGESPIDGLPASLDGKQMNNDIALVNILIDKFIEDSYKDQKLLQSKNKFNVIFYPAPDNSEVSALAEKLDVDLEKLLGGEKKQKLTEMKATFDENIREIYSLAAQSGDFPGCDIWGFFSNKNVDKLCILPGYRNILVILTDGYLLHVQNKKQDGTSYSYLSRSNIDLKGTSLIVERDELDDIEVLMLELNPELESQKPVMEGILGNWLKDMGVTHYMVEFTGVPTNTKKVIAKFLDEN